MSEKAFDYKKEYKDLYMPKDKPMTIEVSSLNFIMVDGSGDPNHNTATEQAVEILYGLSLEPETMKKLDAFMQQEGLRDRLGNGGKHHEIYLSDPRKSKSENMKTVLRHPIAS